MKKTLKIIGYILGILILLLVIGATYVHFSGIPTYKVERPEYPAFKPDSTMIAEGKRLASMVCNQCHMAESGKLEGKYMVDVPKMFGKIWSPNITSHAEFGVGRYSNTALCRHDR